MHMAVQPHNFYMTYALLTKMSTSLKCGGSFSTKVAISSGFEISSLATWTCTPLPTAWAISLASACSLPIRRAVKISLRLEADVCANSRAVLRPMPELAPVMRTVLPARFRAAEVGIMVAFTGLQRTVN
jgi:hypothetical protein